MVSYCGVSDVKRFVFTSMSDADIQKSIEEADDWIIEEIGPQDGNKMEIRKLSALVTARDIKIRDPASVAIGPSGQQIQENPLRYYNERIDSIMSHYYNQIVKV